MSSSWKGGFPFFFDTEGGGIKPPLIKCLDLQLAYKCEQLIVTSQVDFRLIEIYLSDISAFIIRPGKSVGLT